MSAAPQPPPRPAPRAPGASLLRLSAGARLLGALGLLAPLWLVVLWAMGEAP